MEKELTKLGFSQHEATIYMALIDIGQTGTGEIIKKTGLHRNIVYDTLDKLIRRKLVSKVIKQNKAQFQVTDPSRIVSEIESNLKVASEIVPDLAARARVKQEITIYEGLEGFRSYSINMVEQIEPGSTLYILGAIGDCWYDLMGETALKRYEKIRLGKKVMIKMISYEKSARDEAAMKAGRLHEIKVIPKGYENPANTLIWGDTIALQTFTEPYSVVQIRNAALAKSYLNFFDALWTRDNEIPN